MNSINNNNRKDDIKKEDDEIDYIDHSYTGDGNKDLIDNIFKPSLRIRDLCLT